MARQERYRPLPEVGFVRIREILFHIPVSKSTWWAWCASGKAPKAIKLDKKITAWKAEDIRAFIEQLSNQQADA